MRPSLPTPRGSLTELLWDRLQQPPDSRGVQEFHREEPLSDEDAQLALHICYGLHYDGFAGVADQWEWQPDLLGLRAGLEELFVEALDYRSVEEEPGRDGIHLVAQVHRLLVQEDRPSLSTYLATEGTLDDFREFVIHRSVYQRKEADPHTWAIPRLRARAKSAMVALQADEYGGGVPGRSHAELFGATMTALDLDPMPGAYVDRVPAVTLATDNLISLLGLHRRWRGALVGHLAAFEMTSVTPMSKYASAFRRLLGTDDGAEFYDVHVDADVRHQQIAADELLMGLAESDPVASRDIVFGVLALLRVERHFSSHLLESWAEGRSSLLPPLPVVDPGISRSDQSFLKVLCFDESPGGNGVDIPCLSTGDPPSYGHVRC